MEIRDKLFVIRETTIEIKLMPFDKNRLDLKHNMWESIYV